MSNEAFAILEKCQQEFRDFVFNNPNGQKPQLVHALLLRDYWQLCTDSREKPEYILARFAIQEMVFDVRVVAEFDMSLEVLASWLTGPEALHKILHHGPIHDITREYTKHKHTLHLQWEKALASV